MAGNLVVLTGASGSGKTVLARAIEKECAGKCRVCCFDSIGVPSAEVMKTWGDGHQPGGAWQRAMTIAWMKRLVPFLKEGEPVLFEGQMRIAFIYEALALSAIPHARVILVDCDDETRARRLIHDRDHPHLANEGMMGWARYLRDEAALYKCELLDTSTGTVSECAVLLRAYLVQAYPDR